MRRIVCEVKKETIQQKISEDWLLQKFMQEVNSTQQFLNSKRNFRRMGKKYLCFNFRN